MSQFSDDETVILASPNSAFFRHLECTPQTVDCRGTVSAWMAASFPDFSRSHVKWDATYLLAAIFVSRVITFIALTRLDYKAN